MAPSAEGWKEINAGIALTVLATVAVILRFITRLVKKVELNVDDYFALAGLFFVFCMFIDTTVWAAIGGNGQHIETLTPQDLEKFFKIFFANEILYAFTIPVIKLSILFLYRRIFITSGFRMATSIVMGAVIAWGLAVFLASVLQCRPLYAYWDRSVDGNCFNPVQFSLGNQGANIVLDFVILCLPLKMVWNLHRPWPDKLALTFVFLLGGFVCGASIYRMVALATLDPNDLTYSAWQGTLWTIVEPCIGLVCACLPVIRGLFPAYSSKSTSSTKPFIILPGSGQKTSLSPHATQAEYLRMDNYNNDRERLVKSTK